MEKISEQVFNSASWCYCFWFLLSMSTFFITLNTSHSFGKVKKIICVLTSWVLCSILIVIELLLITFWLFCSINFMLQTLLTHFMPLISFYTPWKHHKKILWFHFVFRGYREKPVAWNGLTFSHYWNIQEYWDVLNKCFINWTCASIIKFLLQILKKLKQMFKLERQAKSNKKQKILHLLRAHFQVWDNFWQPTAL